MVSGYKYQPRSCKEIYFPLLLRRISLANGNHRIFTRCHDSIDPVRFEKSLGENSIVLATAVHMLAGDRHHSSFGSKKIYLPFTTVVAER